LLSILVVVQSDLDSSSVNSS